MLAFVQFWPSFLTVEKKEDPEKILELHHHGDWPVGKRQGDVHQHALRPADCRLVVDGESVLAGGAVVPRQGAAAAEVER